MAMMRTDQQAADQLRDLVAEAKGNADGKSYDDMIAAQQHLRAYSTDLADLLYGFLQATRGYRAEHDAANGTPAGCSCRHCHGAKMVLARLEALPARADDV